MVKENRLKDREEADKTEAPSCDPDEEVGRGTYRSSG
jgi:hypothetical protein